MSDPRTWCVECGEPTTYCACYNEDDDLPDLENTYQVRLRVMDAKLAELTAKLEAAEFKIEWVLRQRDAYMELNETAQAKLEADEKKIAALESDLQYYKDELKLAENRIVIAEQSGRRISE